MADSTTPPAGNGLVIPDDTQAKFSAIIELIRNSESMNNEERQYWINILPIMTQDQLKNLEEILTSEKKQLAAIDQKYAHQNTGGANDALVLGIEEKIRSRKAKREEVERKEAAQEEETEEELLSKIQSF